jgi:hypothetical protein
MTEPLHQIVFRWSAQSQIGHDGAGPAAASLAGAELHRWDELLSLRITRTGDGNTAPSLAYLRFGPDSVVLHKVPARDDKGRPGAAIAHALIGPAEVVDVNLALGLDGWSGWAGTEQRSGALRPLSRADLAGDVEQRLRRLRAVDLGDGFEQLLAFALDDPAASFTVVQPGAAATALILGLVDVLGTVRGNEWTFATNEDTDTGPDLPRLVFLDSVPVNIGYAATRPRLHLDQNGFQSGPFPRALATLRRDNGARAVADLRGGQPIATAADVERWRSHVFVSGVILTGDLLNAVTFGTADPSLRAALRTSDGYQTADRQLRGTNHGQLRRLFEAWAANPALRSAYPDVAVLVEAHAVSRCLTRSDASKELFTAVQRAGIGAATLDARLQHWASDRRGGPFTSTRVIDVVQRALDLGMEASIRFTGLRAALEHLPLAQLLTLANAETLTNPKLADLLLSAAEARAFDERDADDASAALVRTSFLRHCVPVLAPDALDASNRWRLVLNAVYGRGLSSDRAGMRRLLDTVARAGEVPAALVYALRNVATDPAERALVDQLAARDRYLAAGLPDIWTERQRSQRVASAPREVPKIQPPPLRPRLKVAQWYLLAIAIAAVVAITVAVTLAATS